MTLPEAFRTGPMSSDWNGTDRLAFEQLYTCTEPLVVFTVRVPDDTRAFATQNDQADNTDTTSDGQAFEPIQTQARAANSNEPTIAQAQSAADTMDDYHSNSNHHDNIASFWRSLPVPLFGYPTTASEPRTQTSYRGPFPASSNTMPPARQAARASARQQTQQAKKQQSKHHHNAPKKNRNKFQTKISIDYRTAKNPLSAFTPSPSPTDTFARRSGLNPEAEPWPALPHSVTADGVRTSRLNPEAPAWPWAKAKEQMQNAEADGVGNQRDLLQSEGEVKVEQGGVGEWKGMWKQGDDEMAATAAAAAATVAGTSAEATETETVTRAQDQWPRREYQAYVEDMPCECGCRRV